MKKIAVLLLISLLECKPQAAGDYITTASGLQYRILKKGEGPQAKAGDQVFIFETTTYRDGTVLYSNENTDNPVPVLIGGGQATDAVDEGLRGMQAGEIREMVAPPELVKRKSYPPNLSPDSSLVMTVRLYRIAE